MPPPLFTILRAPLFFSKNIRTSQAALLRARHSWVPHSQEYLRAQQQEFEKRDIAVKFCELQAGTELVGLTVNVSQPHFLDATPLRRLTLSPLSQADHAYLSEMRTAYFAKIAVFKLLKTVTCITTVSSTGVATFYVCPEMVKMEKKEIPFPTKKSGPTTGSPEQNPLPFNPRF